MNSTRTIGYLTYTLGIIVLVLGVTMPFFLIGTVVHEGPPIAPLSVQPQSRPCDLSVTTFADTNGTHRHFEVTCYESATGSKRLSAMFAPRAESVLVALYSSLAILSIVSAIGVTMIAVVLQGKALGKPKIFMPSFGALCAFSCAIVLTVMFGLTGPLSGSAPPQWGVSTVIVSTIWGYGLSILALAGIITDAPTAQ